MENVSALNKGSVEGVFGPGSNGSKKKKKSLFMFKERCCVFLVEEWE